MDVARVALWQEGWTFVSGVVSGASFHNRTKAGACEFMDLGPSLRERPGLVAKYGVSVKGVRSCNIESDFRIKLA